MGCRSNKNIDKDKVCFKLFMLGTIITNVGVRS
jgi:hypothetical protein